MSYRFLGIDTAAKKVVQFVDPAITLTKVSEVALTGRDWSSDFAKLQNLDVALSTRASESTLSGIKSGTDYLDDIYGRLDTTLSTLAKLIKWSRAVDPAWVHGSEVTAPAAGTALASKAVSAGKKGYIYGFFISAGEANDFKINWTSGATAYSRRIIFGGKGSLHYVDFLSFNEGLPADAGTTVSITNVNAGGTGIVYQAAILYAEV